MSKLPRLAVFLIALLGLAFATGISYIGTRAIFRSIIFGPSVQQILPSAQRVMSYTPQSNSSDNRSFSSDIVRGNIRGFSVLKDGTGQDSDKDIQILGVIEILSNDFIVISGTQVVITAATEFEDYVSVGDIVKVPAFIIDNGALVAREVEFYESQLNPPGR